MSRVKEAKMLVSLLWGRMSLSVCGVVMAGERGDWCSLLLRRRGRRRIGVVKARATGVASRRSVAGTRRMVGASV